MVRSPSSGTVTDGQGRPPPDGERPTFERIDWGEVGGWRRWFTGERILFVGGLTIVALLFAYHRHSGETYLVFRWLVDWEDWLAMVSLVVIVAYGLVPILKNPQWLRRVAFRLWGRWGTLLAAIVLLGIIMVGIWALLSGYRALIPWQDSIDRLQPPVGATVSRPETGDCAGAFANEAGGTVCQGTWKYPLGTDSSGYKMTELVVMGTRPIAYVTIVTLGLIAPLATVVGTMAGYYGGILDDLLMAYVDIQLSLPAMLIYLLIYMFVLNSMAVFLLAFGLLSWGGIARIVRSETLQRREAGHVQSARAAGAPGPYVIRRHILPNVANTAIPAAFHLIAIIVITEAGLSFLGFNPIDQSWGHSIARGFTRAHPIVNWWVAGFPALALALTVVSCKIIGDGLRDVLDPRGEA